MQGTKYGRRVRYKIFSDVTFAKAVRFGPASAEWAALESRVKNLN